MQKIQMCDFKRGGKSPMFCVEITDKTNSSQMLMLSPQGIVEGENIIHQHYKRETIAYLLFRVTFCKCSKVFIVSPTCPTFLGGRRVEKYVPPAYM